MATQQRQLRSVRTDQVLGQITVDDGAVAYTGAAENVLTKVVTRFGADAVMRDGWSNGYLYLADPAEGAAQII